MLMAVVLLSLFFPGAAYAGGPDPVPVRFAKNETGVFLSADDVAASQKLELKIVAPRKLVTFCREGDIGYCVPIRLTDANHLLTNGQLWILDTVVRDTFHVVTKENDGVIRLIPAETETGTVKGAYNAEWGPNRGFAVGQTLPDIPFQDMNGGEVRFSRFLGKRYILYCWASW